MGGVRSNNQDAQVRADLIVVIWVVFVNTFFEKKSIDNIVFLLSVFDRHWANTPE
jgi:hypothetical protein